MQLSEQLHNKTVQNTKRRMSKSPNGAENDYDLGSDSDDYVCESEADPNPSTSTAHHNS